MVKLQNVRSINKLVASVSNRMHCFEAIAGSIREKIKIDITRPPLTKQLNNSIWTNRKQVKFLKSAPGGIHFYQHSVT